ncbi:MAG: hypothetical protein AB7U76_24290 [Pirellulales bacterium]
MVVKQYRVVVEAITNSDPHGRVTISKIFSSMDLQSRMDNGETAIGLEAQDMYRRIRDLAGVVTGEAT